MKQVPTWKLQFLKSLRATYDDMANQTKTSINKLVSQNMYIDNQLKLLQINSPSNHMKPTYGISNRYDEINFQDKKPFMNRQQSLSTLNSSVNFQKNKPNQSNSSENSDEKLVQSLRNPGSEQVPMGSVLTYQQNQYEKAESQAQNPSTKIQVTQPPAKKPSNYRKAISGKLQDVPGNPIENRLIHEFFTKQLEKFIEIDGVRESQINKKELLACYVMWRLRELPEQKKMKLVAIQMIISGYIRINLKQCKVLRQTYSGMKFKSFKVIKELKRINLDNYKLYERRGGRRMRKLRVTMDESDEGDEESADELQSEQVKKEMIEDESSEQQNYKPKRGRPKKTVSYNQEQENQPESKNNRQSRIKKKQNKDKTDLDQILKSEGLNEDNTDKKSIFSDD